MSEGTETVGQQRWLSIKVSLLIVLFILFVAGNRAWLRIGIYVLSAFALLEFFAEFVGKQTPKLNRWLAERGRYNLALWINKLFHSLPGCGISLEGWILITAGRFAEALEALKPLAFDKDGQPRLKSTALAYYISALQWEGKFAEAENLFEAAILVPQTWWFFHEGLAEHLLNHNKGAKRACELMEYVFSNWEKTLSNPSQRGERAKFRAILAWAFAGCGRFEEAEAKLQEAFEDDTKLNDFDLATLQLYAGNVWWRLYYPDKARAAFQEAEKFNPRGPVSLKAGELLDNLNKWSLLHGSSESFRGWRIQESGHYAEARDVFKPLAFDEKGQPRLTSMDFHQFATALWLNEEYAEAQHLFEVAIQVPQESGLFHDGLAKCLLSQNKEPNRACELIEQVLDTYADKLVPEDKPSRMAHWISIHAWALARCRRREEAESQLKKAFTVFVTLGERNQALLQLYAGEVWKTLGEPEKARAAFMEAERLCPKRSIGLRAQKALAELDKQS
ncbi:MAG: hypothetical protein WAN35_07400 [Terracidiphilus sp.]